MILHHPNCRDADCEICMADHMALQAELERRTGDKRTDHLGKYHSWLSKNGIPAETKWGWATPEAFDDENIAAYVAYRME
jgi:hypothetical protein